MKKFYGLILLTIVACTSFSQAQYVDKTFGNNGYAVTNFGSSAILNSMAVQANGKIVVAGTDDENFAVSRCNTDGSIDNNFGNNGKVVTDIGNSEDARAVVLQDDGKIIVAGNTKVVSGSETQSQIAVVRYNADGSLDKSFGNNGIVITVVNKQASAYAMALQTDGKIIIAGSTESVDNSILLIRYNTNGAPDNSFGNNGEVISSFAAENEAYAISLQPDGKILAAGYTYDGVSGSTNSVLVRYDENGILDNSFSEDGYLINYGGVATSLALQSDGKILLGGRGYNDNYDPYGTVQRINPDGTTDTDYGNFGYISGGYYSNFTSYVYSIILQPDGKAVVAATHTSGFPDYKTSLFVIRLTDKGKADSTFGNNGLISTSNQQLSFGSPAASPLALDGEGRILVGETYDLSFAVTRLLPQNAVAVTSNQQQQQHVLNLRVYPNPVASNLIVDGLDKSLPAVVTIADIAGNIMQVRKISAGTNSVNVISLKQGRYVAVFNQDKKTASLKFIKR
jgi:uncharacterized delta-60 repeat protein